MPKIGRRLTLHVMGDCLAMPTSDAGAWPGVGPPDPEAPFHPRPTGDSVNNNRRSDVVSL